MTHLIYYLSIAIFAVIFAVQIRKTNLSFHVFCRKVFWGSSIAVLLSLLYYSYAQFKLWQSSEVTQFFFTDGPGYFLGYVSHRFWAQYIVSFLIALLFLWMAKKYNKRHGEHFFYPEEPYILATMLFLLGHPLWIVYLALVLVLYALFSLFYRLRYLKRQNDVMEPRVSFYYGWIPTALLVILMKGTLVVIPAIQILVFDRTHFII